MTNEHCLKDRIISIDDSIEHAVIKGQNIKVVEPVQILGQLNLSKLSTHYKKALEKKHQADLQIGVDEAGRGPLLGCVTVAAAILPSDWSGLIEDQPLMDSPLSILTDSKKLSEKKRDMLYPLIKQHAIGYVVAEVPAAVIDQVNILQATMLGMQLCIETLLQALARHRISKSDVSKSEFYDVKAQVLVDGNRCPDINFASLKNYGFAEADIDCQAWIKGDARHTSIAAASILAKVSRDLTMHTLDAQHPQYGIAKHKGYPTQAHLAAVQQYGVLSEHRRSFGPIKRVVEKEIL